MNFGVPSRETDLRASDASIGPLVAREPARLDKTARSATPIPPLRTGTTPAPAAEAAVRPQPIEPEGLPPFVPTDELPLLDTAETAPPQTPEPDTAALGASPEAREETVQEPYDAADWLDPESTPPVEPELERESVPAEPTETTPEGAGPSTEILEEMLHEPTGTERWFDDDFMSLGEAEPEDEIPFATPAPPEAPATDVPDAEQRPAEAALTGLTPERMVDIATRLEQIAGALRARSSGGPFAEYGTDALSALITGYLIGLSESQEPRGAGDKPGGPGSS